MSRLIDMTGRVFGRLTVLRRADCTSSPTQWLVRCSCGTEKTMNGQSLKRGLSRSCGCLKNELLAARKRTHGCEPRDLYNIWCGMISRCENHRSRSFKNYGGRGISICARWRRDFVAFASDVGARPSASHSLDRIDNNGNYEPGNVRWALMSQQCNNKRTNRVVEFNGERMSLADACRSTGSPYQATLDRIRRGWSPVDALSVPVLTGKHARRPHFTVAELQPARTNTFAEENDR